MAGYYSLLKDPKWLKKSIRIRKRDNYRCTVCGSSQYLEVHHTYYIQGRLPWEYPSKSLITLCSTCHLEHHRHFEIEVRRLTKSGKKIIINKPKKPKLQVPKIFIRYINGKKYRKVKRVINKQLKEVWRPY